MMVTLNDDQINENNNSFYDSVKKYIYFIIFNIGNIKRWLPW